MQAWAARFYGSKAWHCCRSGYIAQRINMDGGRCEVCREAQGFIVHHVVPLTPENINDPAVSLNWENLQYVCKDCHDQFEGHGLRRNTAPALVRFDADGNPVDRVLPPV